MSESHVQQASQTGSTQAVTSHGDTTASNISTRSAASLNNTPSITRRPWYIRYGKLTFRFLLGQWFLISLGLVILVASQVQVPQEHQKLKSTVVSYLCVSVIFFLTGCTLSTKILVDNFARWKIHVFVQIQIYLVTSAVIFGIVSLCATNPDFMDAGLLLGLILAGCTPTTIASNVIMTGQAHGNSALTVVESTLSNFLGPFLTPVLFQMYISPHQWYTDVLPDTPGGYGEIYRRVFKQLGLSLFVPMVVGQLVQHLLPSFTSHVIVGWKLTKISPLALLVIVWQTYDQAFGSNAFETIKGDNMIFVVFVSVGLFGLFIAIAVLTSIYWLPMEDTIAVAYIVPAKTPAMGVPIAMTMYAGLNPTLEAKLQIPMVVYQGLQIVGGTIFVRIFRRWIDSSKSQKKIASRKSRHTTDV